MCRSRGREGRGRGDGIDVCFLVQGQYDDFNSLDGWELQRGEGRWLLSNEVLAISEGREERNGSSGVGWLGRASREEEREELRSFVEKVTRERD